MAFDTDNGPGLKSDINVTPLVDVMLVLLIIFMLITPFLTPSLRIELPLARHLAAVASDPDHILTVTVDATGVPRIDDRTLDGPSLRSMLRDRRDSDPLARVQVRADRAASYGRIRIVLEAVRDAGFAGAELLASDEEES